MKSNKSKPLSLLFFKELEVQMSEEQKSEGANSQPLLGGSFPTQYVHHILTLPVGTKIETIS